MKKVNRLVLFFAIVFIAGCITENASNTIRSGNMTYGIPSNEDFIICRTGYALGFRDKDKQPAWVMYRLTAEQLKIRDELKIRRTDDFRPDPLVLSESATPEDYKRSGYDRGHMAPAADMGWSVQTMHDSFYMSNMSPQDPMCNRKIWADLENAVREFARKEGSVFIATGPVFGTNLVKKTIGIQHKITVPDAYYKALYAENSDKMIGFIVPNCGTTNSIAFFACSIDDIEDATKLDFFSKLPMLKQEQLESENNISFFSQPR